MSVGTPSSIEVRKARRVSGRSRPRPEPDDRDESKGFDRTYWLGHCEGFRVDTANGRLGLVEEVVGDDGAATLRVRAGRLGRRVLLVPAAEVAFIVPRAERIWLRSPVAIAGSERAG